MITVMERERLAPATTEDEHADQVVRRGRNAGGGWIVASVSVFGWCLVTTSFGAGAVAFVLGGVLFAIGMFVRARYWKRARRELGDATVQRALWRSTQTERDSSDRLIIACAVVILLLAYQLWKR